MSFFDWGSLGHAFVLLVFVSAACAAWAFYTAGRMSQARRRAWQRYAYGVFFVHMAALVGVIALLYVLILSNRFDYHYAWAHTMRSLPLSYKISCFWEGQEGSFLLWMFWNAVIGVVLLCTRHTMRLSVMAVLCMVQVFLSAMILGVVIGPVKIGSSPFLLLREVINTPIFADNPAFVPEDGTGLNPLLQNYWMVIHPPVLFAGFALTTLPFAYATVGLWQGRYTAWIAPARTAMLWAVLILAVGIMMGAYWAYETLNFGGYWNWDPVENAVYIPWLAAVAALHSLRLSHPEGKYLKMSLVFCVLPFLLILYATFLVRSGILGDTSVHAFTDLGLSEQLMGFALLFSLFFAALFWWRRSALPQTHTSFSWYRADTWLLMGIAVLCLMGFQVLIPTSIPLFNALGGLFGGKADLAPPAEPVSFYTKYQVFFALFLLVFSATAQLLWWGKVGKHEDRDSPEIKDLPAESEDTKSRYGQWARVRTIVLLPLIGSLALSSVLALLIPIQNVTWILLVAAALYAFFANLRVLFSLSPQRLRSSGGILAHIGIALMVLGFLSSSGYSKKISLNRTGLIWHEDFPEEINQENILLFQHETRKMDGFDLYYKGPCRAVSGLPFYVSEADMTPTNNRHDHIAKRTLEHQGSVYARAGDTLHLAEPAKRYFKVQYVAQDSQDTLQLLPRALRIAAQNILYSPDIVRYWNKDLYTHVRTFSDPEQRVWSTTEQMKTRKGQSFFVNDYIATLVRLQTLPSWENLSLDTGDVVVKAYVRILGNQEYYMATPVYIIKDGQVGHVWDEVAALGIRLRLQAIHPEEDAFTWDVQTTQKPWVILEIMEKPLINLLWLGVGFLTLGLLMALKRKTMNAYFEKSSEGKNLRKKNEEKV